MKFFRAVLSFGLILTLAVAAPQQVYADETDTQTEADAEESTVALVPRGTRTALTATPEAGRVALNWEPVEGAVAYRIYRSLTKKGGYHRIKSVKPEVTYFAVDAEVGIDYYYKIIPLYYNEKGRKKRDIASNTVVAASYEAAPQIVDYDFSDNVATIAWTKLETFDGYLVMRSDQPTKGYKRYAYLKGLDVTTYSDENVAEGGTYYYKVCGYYTVAKKKYFGERSDYIMVSDAVIEEEEPEEAMAAGEPFEEPAAEQTGEVETPEEPQKTLPQIIAESTPTDLHEYAAKYGGRFGIDISKWQGEMDFGKVQAAGVSFIMMRAAAGLNLDVKFEEYMQQAAVYGFETGVYVYSRALTVEEAEAEAENVIEILGGRELAFPIAYDMEDSSQLRLTTQERTQIALAFQERIETYGYRFILYANKYWLTTLFENERLEGMDIWIARYTDFENGHEYEGCGNVRMWQFSSKGVIDGITENYVDLDIYYEPETAVYEDWNEQQ